MKCILQTDHERHTENLFGDDFDLKPIRTESSSESGSSFPKKSTFAFDDSVPSTPFYNLSNSPSRFNEGSEHSFDPFSRFDSFKSNDYGLFQPRDATLARFDSIRSTADTDHGHGFASFDDSDPFGTGPFRTSLDSQTPRRGSDNWSAFQFGNCLLLFMPEHSDSFLCVLSEFCYINGMCFPCVLIQFSCDRFWVLVIYIWIAQLSIPLNILLLFFFSSGACQLSW